MNAQRLQTLPRLEVLVDQAPLPRNDARTLGEVRVQQRLSLPTLCELAFFDPPGLASEAGAIEPGSLLRVDVPEHDTALFVGQVTAVEYAYEPSRGRVVRVRGYDLLHRLRKRQPVRAHVQVTTADLARELVADLGVRVEGVAGSAWPRLIQDRQSDLALLQEVTERGSLYFTLRGDVLHLLTLEGTGDAQTLALGTALLEARIEVNGDGACRQVSVGGWDPLLASPHWGKAHAARVGRAIRTSLDPLRLGGTGERTLTGATTHDDRQAQDLAQAELDVRVHHDVFFWGVAEGDPRLRPGVPVAVEGVAGPLAGRYVLTQVDHTIDGVKGFVSEVSTALPEKPARERATFATLGVVTRVDDPDNQGRVRVSLPAFGEVETGWMGVLAPGAGTAKGLVALPDVDDAVLVLAVNGDPAQGIVLGGLYGAQGPPDAGVANGTVARYTFVTPGGQRIRLDDTDQTLRLENRDGSFVELGPQRVRIHARRDLEIEAPGQRIVIRGRAIDFEQG